MAYQTAEKIAAASGFADPIAASLPKLPPCAKDVRAFTKEIYPI